MGVKVENITHIYAEGLPDESIAIQDVSFEIFDGEFVGIIGHTGSGKSTLLQHLNGLLKPKTGKVYIDDVEITTSKAELKKVRKKIGMVFQYPEYQLFEDTVSADVAFGPKNLGLDEEEIQKRVRKGIELVGLDYESVADKSPFELSGGQKRRAAIAGVVAMEPKVLILDEPTAGLDPKAHKDILDMIISIHEQHADNITILVSHNMRDIAKLCSKVLVMNKGQLVMMGTPKEIFSRYDELTKMGLAVPPVAEFMHKLADGGLDFDEIPLTIEDAAEMLAVHLKNKQNKEI